MKKPLVHSLCERIYWLHDALINFRVTSRRDTCEDEGHVYIRLHRRGSLEHNDDDDGNLVSMYLHDSSKFICYALS